MKKRTVFIILAAVMVLVLSAVPAMADNKPVDTEVTVIGGGSPPIIQAMWVQDKTQSLEDGDPQHMTPGAQFLPPMEFGGKKYLDFFVIVTSPEGVSTIELVEINVYFKGGLHILQLILERVDNREVGIDAYTAACSAGLVEYGSGYDHAEVAHHLQQSQSVVYMATGYLHYHYLGGFYEFSADAMGTFGNWASTDGTDLCSIFWYIPVGTLELDFNKVDYGTVQVGAQKLIVGDNTFLPGDGKPTVRNIGNTDLLLYVAQDDMGFGYSGTGADKEWNVKFSAGRSYYEPGWVKGSPVPDPIPWNWLDWIGPGETRAMSFGIEVVKSKPSVKCGQMLIHLKSLVLPSVPS